MRKSALFLAIRKTTRTRVRWSVKRKTTVRVTTGRRTGGRR